MVESRAARIFPPDALQQLVAALEAESFMDECEIASAGSVKDIVFVVPITAIAE